MKNTFIKITAILVIVFGVWYFYPMLRSTKSVLYNSDAFVLYSLKPRSELAGYKVSSNDEEFHQNLVLGKTLIAKPEVRRQLLDALYDGIENREVYDFQAACFNPRHGIRATLGRRTVDVVICFECGHVHFHQSGYRRSSEPVNSKPQPIFDSVLKQNGVPLGTRRH